MTKPKGGDLSQFYRIHTPIDVPLRFCKDGYYRLAANVECARCGRGFVVTIRCHRYLEQRSPLAIPKQTKRPDPRDENVISSFMLSACNHGVGCANRLNFFRDPSTGVLLPNLFDFFKDRTALCLHGPGEECPTCDPCRKPVKWLKWAPHLHTKTCPVGQMVRTGPFHLTGMQASRTIRR